MWWDNTCAAVGPVPGSSSRNEASCQGICSFKVFCLTCSLIWTHATWFYFSCSSVLFSISVGKCRSGTQFPPSTKELIISIADKKRREGRVQILGTDSTVAVVCWDWLMPPCTSLSPTLKGAPLRVCMGWWQWIVTQSVVYISSQWNPIFKNYLDI